MFIITCACVYTFMTQLLVYLQVITVFCYLCGYALLIVYSSVTTVQYSSSNKQLYVHVWQKWKETVWFQTCDCANI